MQEQAVGNPFRFSLAEFSGSLADLGVMLPLILALISLKGMDATAVFVGAGAGVAPVQIGVGPGYQGA